MSASQPTSLGITICAAARTDVGRTRERNEDRYLLAELSTKQRALEGKIELSSAGILLGVCDGMGGAAAGDVASFIAVDTIVTHMERNAAATEQDFARELVRAVEVANDAIANDAIDNAKRHGMGTTCTVAGCRGRSLFLGQIGDSRAYLLRQGVLTQITRDQTLVGELVAMGSMTPEAALTSARANVILQALGRGKIRVDLTSLELRRGDRLLVCSDGLTKMVKDAEIAHALDTEADLDACCEKLVALANDAGGNDNITVALCEFNGDGLREPTEDDVAAYTPHVFVSEEEAALQATVPVVQPPATVSAEPHVPFVQESVELASAGPAPSLFPEEAPKKRRRAVVVAAAVLLCLLLLALAPWEGEAPVTARVADARRPAVQPAMPAAAAVPFAEPLAPPQEPQEALEELPSEPPTVAPEEPKKRPKLTTTPKKGTSTAPAPVLPWSQNSKVAEDPFK